MVLRHWVLILTVAFAFSAQAGPGARTPHGYAPGRADATYGTYSSKFGARARVYQDRLLELENQAYGLVHQVKEDPALQCEAVYLLENEILRLHIDIVNAPRLELTAFEREAMAHSTIQTYRSVRHHAERLFENMIREIDRKLPGPNGLQSHREADGSTHALYLPSYRSDAELTSDQRFVEYEKLKSAFLKSGGSLKEIKNFGPTWVKSRGTYTWAEYAWLPNGSVKVTEGKAGHVLLAQGGEVQSAGQIVLIKNSAGQVTWLIVSNASGNYKPDLLSTERFAARLRNRLGLEARQVVVTKGEPLSTQGVKIYLKGEGYSREVIRQRVDELEARAHEIRFPNPFSRPDCAAIF